MLFTSFEFLFLFMPVTLAGFYLVGRTSHRAAALWLAIASLFFYGWWNPRFVLLLLASVAFNYSMGYLLAARQQTPQGKLLLSLSVATNLLVLGIFKYANFFVSSVNAVTGADWPVLNIVLPLGISFFTFTQIAFLVDVYRGIAREFNLIHYLLFVTYFPHLIAGPVLHHKQMMPQFGYATIYRPNAQWLALGLTYFTIGLFKKVVAADSFADYASPVFDAVSRGADPNPVAAWIGALAYTLQLYFDFSGYSDMAIGLSAMIGVQLPLNFNSPYKARNIVDFWRRWHMTLSAFLRDYLYIALGGNRYGTLRRYVNLMVTMLLGGLWHGANWTFVIWGGLHGLFLVVNHGWSAFKERVGVGGAQSTWFGELLGGMLTFSCVVVAWIFFRAESVSAALRLIGSMFDFRGAMTSIGRAATFADFFPAMMVPPNGSVYVLSMFAIGFAAIWLSPNSQELIDRARGTIVRFKHWFIGASLFLIGLLSIVNFSRGSSEFIYFNF